MTNTSRKKNSKKGRKKKQKALLRVIAAAALICACLFFLIRELPVHQDDPAVSQGDGTIPPYQGEPYEYVNNGIPFFSDGELVISDLEVYSEPDTLGRCGYCMAVVGRETMPKVPREPIGDVYPTGWKNVRYDGIDRDYLYNRCHLIAYQLTGQNSNPRNLITGTRYLNTQGMEPFENKTAHYINDTGNHVLYRVTPVFTGNNLVADGVLMEASSIEDKGRSLQFCVFCYNVQPGVTIDYRTGDSEGPAFTGSRSADAGPD